MAGGWLIGRPTRNERGAIAALIALLMTSLLGFTALAIDVARMHLEKVQLQTGADAAVFAIAAECLRDGQVSCASTAEVRADFYAENNNSGMADAEHTFPAAGTVTVRTAAKDQDGPGMPMYFATILGIKRTSVEAQATVNYGGPLKGNATLPMAFAECQFDLTGKVQLLRMHGEGGDDTTTCPGRNPSGQRLPGGFEWLLPASASEGGNGCFAKVTVDTIMDKNSGLSQPSECAAVFASLRGKTIILPVYDEIKDDGYHIRGFAAFVLLGYRFPSDDWDNTKWGAASCKPPCVGVIGRFINFTDTSGAFTAGGPIDLGAKTMRLEE